MSRPITVMNPNKQRFLKLMKESGFSSINKFSEACGMPSSNVHLNLSGKYALSVERAFRYADTLRVPVQDVLAVFYPKETKANLKKILRRNM